MSHCIYTLEEVLANTGVTKKDLDLWQEQKLFQPVGYTGDKQPIFSDASVEEILHIKKLQDIGYDTPDIRKIIKKVGLPHISAKENKNGHQFLTVGHLAEQVDVSARTIKHWENIGIIEPDMRSEGGFRLYSRHWVYLCQLVKDLQLFGYTLEEIKTISDYFREFMALQKAPESDSKQKVADRIAAWQKEIDALFEKMDQYKQGIQRWEELLKKKKKEIVQLASQNEKRPDSGKGDSRD